MNTIVKKQFLNKNFVNYLTKLRFKSENSGTFTVKSTDKFLELFRTKDFG